MTTPSADTVPTTILLYARGTWTQVQLNLPAFALDWDAAMQAAGWEEDGQCDLGSEDVGGIWFRMWRRTSNGNPTDPLPPVLIDICTTVRSDRVLAGDIADAMDLLARWAPLAQFGAISRFIEGIESGATALAERDNDDRGGR